MNTNYLIDTENMGSAFLNRLKMLDKGDTVYIFYSNVSAKLTFDEAMLFKELDCKIELIKTEKSANNYLDFQLSSYLGHLTAKRPKQRYVIIARDKGYFAVTDLWKGRGYNVMQDCEILAYPKTVCPKNKLSVKNLYVGTNSYIDGITVTDKAIIAEKKLIQKMLGSNPVINRFKSYVEMTQNKITKEEANFMNEVNTVDTTRLAGYNIYLTDSGSSPSITLGNLNDDSNRAIYDSSIFSAGPLSFYILLKASPQCFNKKTTAALARYYYLI